MITITENAWLQIHKKLEAANIKNVRVQLNTRGCGGNSYEFTLVDDDPAEQEFFVEQNNHKVIIDPKIEIYLIGSTLDWVKVDKFSERFDFINDNETSRCGCGESVSFN